MSNRGSVTVINSLIEDNVNNSLLGKHPELSEDPNFGAYIPEMKTNAQLEKLH